MAVYFAYCTSAYNTKCYAINGVPGEAVVHIELSLFVLTITACCCMISRYAGIVLNMQELSLFFLP